MVRTLFLFFLFALIGALPARGSPLSLTGRSQAMDANHTFSYFVDHDGSATPEAIGRMVLTDTARGMQTLGRFVVPVWMVIELRNETSATSDWDVYSVSNYVHDHIDFFQLTNNVPVAIGHTGSLVPVAQRSLAHHFLGTTLHLPPGDTATILVRIQSRFPISNDFVIQDGAAYIDAVSHHFAAMGLFLGIVTIVCIFSAIYYAMLKEPGFLFFAPTCLANGLVVFMYSGFWDTMLTKGNWWPAASLMQYVIFISPTVNSIFTYRFLEMRTRSPLQGKFNLAATALLPIAILLGIFDAPTTVLGRLIELMFAGRMMFLIWTYFSYRKQAFPPATYWIAANVVSHLAMVVWLLCRFGILPVSPDTAMVPMAGTTIMIGIVSLAIIERMRAVNRQRILAERTALETDELRTVVRVLSHDLANPLMVIGASVHMGLKNLTDKDTQSKLWLRVKRAVEVQTDIITNVRTQRALRDGKVDSRRSAISVRDVLNEAYFLFEERVAAKGVSWEVDFGGAEDFSVMAEKVGLTHHIIGNIISNAIKFSQHGKIIAIRVTASSREVSIEVRDQGIGMPANLVKNVFDRSLSTSRPGTSGEHGTGFGMPLVKNYIESFDGHITVISRCVSDFPDSSGTTVTITLPCAA